jgi:hypothetical protein
MLALARARPDAPSRPTPPEGLSKDVIDAVFAADALGSG